MSTRSRKKNTRRAFVKSITGLGISGYLAACANPIKRFTGQPPNIVFILADGWSPNYLSCYYPSEFNTRPLTPNLDRLAAEGFKATNFYANAASPSPSRSSFFTGKLPRKHGIKRQLRTQAKNIANQTADYLSPLQPNIARLLWKNGYTTAHFGSWQLSGIDVIDAPSPKAYGFEHHKCCHVPYEETPYSPPAHWNTWEALRNPQTSWNRFLENANTYTIDAANSFLEKHRKGPFYLQVWLFPEPGKKKEEQNKEARRQFIHDTDFRIGRLIQKLKDLEKLENTVIVFSSDTGPEPENQTTQKGHRNSAYEEGIKIPFIAKWQKGIAPGQVNQSLLSSIDLLPTIASICETRIANRTDLDGEDFFPALYERKVKRFHPLVWEVHESENLPNPNISPKLGIREGKWKLLCHYDGLGQELYDLENDPNESQNLVGENPLIAQRLSKRLLSSSSIDIKVHPNTLEGIVVDEVNAVLTGVWLSRRDQPHFIGSEYRMTHFQQYGLSTARFSTDLPQQGKYEVRFLHPADDSFSNHVPIRIHHSNGIETKFINQQKAKFFGDLTATSLGEYTFTQKQSPTIEITNLHTKGFVVIDAIQFIPKSKPQIKRKPRS